VKPSNRKPNNREPAERRAPSIAYGHYSDRRFDVVAIGASAGGLHALGATLAPLDPSFPSSILVVQHLDPHHRSLMGDLLARQTKLRVKQAEHGELIMPGVVYIAPPDEHLLVGPGKVQLAHSQLVHYSRPSIDLLFESVAGTYGSRSVGIVLSGSNRDGAAGIRAIREAGGVTLVQQPDTAEFKTMPQAAIATGCVDLVADLASMASLITELCQGTRVLR
jgi:two-component system, chemotaxis family, protein-glutamate methylesterase/glutaminase